MSNTYKLRLKLLSRAVIGSAEGYGAVIDKDIMFDDLGIPYIPARRIKGCMRDSAIEVLDMLKQAGINDLIDITDDKNEKFKYKTVNEIFGIPGMDKEAQISFHNLHIANYKTVREWINYLLHERNTAQFISRDSISSYYTHTNQQTAIDESTGTAAKHSLRTVRSIKANMEFIGEIHLANQSDSIDTLLALAALNLRYIGSMRTRGFGRIKCSIEGINTANVLKRLEGICIN
ncbi:MAG: RAMP superfamily CRISPR-associated protein [Thermodesulfovibrionales bacterium]|nr:RAMP superfamily CRISPR-associated protein [Thermodesulfovibrionales bacterium]